MNLKRYTYYLTLLTLLFCLPQQAKASHIVGGEITYRCLGGTRYEVTFSIYRDCIGGLQGAINEDNPARISVYTTAGIKVSRDSEDDNIYATLATGEIIPPNFKNDCVTNPPATCLNRIVFKKIFDLNTAATGYKIIYDRCCRNASIINIINPADAGATYSCIIPQASGGSCNNSAVFKNFPPQIICVNNPLVYDHGATDPDGDSLSYEFCQAFDGGSKGNTATYPRFNASPLTYRSPYSSGNPMAGNPRIQINPRTGMITGTPTLQGRFVVTVCCHEWRGGVRINTTTREFQFVVTNCSKAVVADIPQYSSDFNTYIVNCLNNTVFFVNTSRGGSTYFWDFGVNDLSTDTSSAFEPTFTYADSGTYVVTQYVNRGTTCSDSISRFVKVYPKLEVRFSAPSVVCPGDTVNFIDNTSSSYEIDSWQWNFDDYTPIDSNQNATHIFPYGGLYNVGFIVTNKQGCVDTMFQNLLVDPFKPNMGRDTTIVKGESIQFNSTGGIDYKWLPVTNLSNPNIPNPIGFFPDTGTFLYTVSVQSPQTVCIGRDSIIVRVIGDGYLALPNAFTPNGDGQNDRFRPLLVGYQSIKYFRVFNRYGEMMFNSSNIEDSWDGTFKGKEQELGVYYWLISAVDRFGKEVIEKGDITLLR